jgi:hypothetical protein
VLARANDVELGYVVGRRRCEGGRNDWVEGSGQGRTRRWNRGTVGKILVVTSVVVVFWTLIVVGVVVGGREVGE